MVPKTKFIDEELAYTGAELRPHWILTKTSLSGDAIVSWVGPCDVRPDCLVDIRDRIAADGIRAEKMLHFLVEHFACNIFAITALQRLLVCVTAETLLAHGASGIRRNGDDLFVGQRKLSVSVATCSPVSGLIHLGLNITANNAPVPTATLAELSIAPRPFALAVMDAYAQEVRSILDAATRVSPR